MKKLLYIAIVLLTGCFEPNPETTAQIVEEQYLDSLYRNGEVRDKANIGYYSMSDYLDTSKKDYMHRSIKQEVHESLIHFHNASISDLVSFTGKVDSVLSKVKGINSSYMILEVYTLNKIHYNTAFFVDSSCNKVLAKIEFCADCQMVAH